MDDITNNINNIGKPLPLRKIDIRLSLNELAVLKSLCQNPHEVYQDHPEMMEIAEALFNSMKMTYEYHTRN